MCAPITATDNDPPASTVSSFDIHEQIERVRVRLVAMGEAAIKIMGGATRDAMGGSNRAALASLIGAEMALDDLRTMIAEGMTGRMPAAYVSSTDLPILWRDRIEENEIAAGLRPRDPLLTAMRRAEAAGDGDPLVLAAHARGSAIAVGLPAYGAHDAGFGSFAEA